MHPYEAHVKIRFVIDKTRKTSKNAEKKEGKNINTLFLLPRTCIRCASLSDLTK